MNLQTAVVTSAEGASASVHDLLVRFKHGDIEALEILFARYWGPFVFFAVRRGVTYQEAEDIAQDAFDAIIKSIASYREDPGGGASWMWTICRRKLSHFFRDRGRDAPPVDVDVEAIHGKDLIKEWELWECAIESFAALPLQDQTSIRNRMPGDSGPDPHAFGRWKTALHECWPS